MARRKRTLRHDYPSRGDAVLSDNGWCGVATGQFVQCRPTCGGFLFLVFWPTRPICQNYCTNGEIKPDRNREGWLVGTRNLTRDR